jgi:hypothetical protein
VPNEISDSKQRVRKMITFLKEKYPKAYGNPYPAFLNDVIKGVENRF